MNNDICVVFVSNKKYFNKFLNTCIQLRTNGNYLGNICLVVGDDLKNDQLIYSDFIIKNKILIKYFPDIEFNDNFYFINKNIKTDGRNITKKFQWHKLYLFNIYFKQWNYILYIDCGMNIFSNISPIIDEARPYTLLAHSDAYPTYEWKLYDQFDKNNVELYKNLSSKYNLSVDYFQTTMLLYDSNIILDNTFNDIYHLALKYPISRTNEQGIIALYFTNIKPIFKQLKLYNSMIYYYDFLSRDSKNKYIMLKYITPLNI